MITVFYTEYHLNFGLFSLLSDLHQLLLRCSSSYMVFID